MEHKFTYDGVYVVLAIEFYHRAPQVVLTKFRTILRQPLL